MSAALCVVRPRRSSRLSSAAAYSRVVGLRELNALPSNRSPTIPFYHGCQARREGDDSSRCRAHSATRLALPAWALFRPDSAQLGYSTADVFCWFSEVFDG